MPTAAERQAVAFLATVAVLGAGVRMVQANAFERALDRAEAVAFGELTDSTSLADGRAAEAAGARAFDRQRAAVDSAREARKSRNRNRVAILSRPIDPDVATATELEALPRIGPALAARIIADRDSLGPFGSVEAMQRVRGIGPALATGLAPHVTFSSGLRPLHGETRVP